MKMLLLAFFALFLTARFSIAGNPIEFSADTTEFTGEGIIYHRLTFKDDKRIVFYQLPQGWTCSLNGNALRLTPPGKSFAEAQIESIPFDKPMPLDDTTTAALTQRFLSTMPPESQQVALVKQEQDPVPFSNNRNFEVVASYKLLGDTFQRSILFVNTSENQIVFKLTARKSDFDALYRVFRASIGSWQWVESAELTHTAAK